MDCTVTYLPIGHMIGSVHVIPKWEILMVYISRSCDWLVIYVIKLCNQITKKGNIDSLHKGSLSRLSFSIT
jgi:hypothetical protein